MTQSQQAHNNPANDNASHHYKIPEVAAIASAYALATTPFNIMPLIVSAIIAGFGIGEGTAGAITTVELLTMSITAFLLAPLAPKLVSRKLFIFAVGLAVVAHTATLFTDSPASFLMARILAGLAAGILLMGLNTRIACAHDPVRLYGIATVTGTVISVILLIAIPILIHQFNYLALFAVLAILGLIILPVQRLAPAQTNHKAQSQVLTKLPLILIGLLILGLFIIQLVQSGYYAFVERMAQQHALPPEAIGGLLSVAYLTAVPGSALATWLGERWGNIKPIVIGLLGHIIAILLACYSDNTHIFYAAVIAQTFFYFFSIPYQLSIAAHLDSSGRLASISAAVFFFGLACGPILGGWLIENWGYQGIAISVVTFTTLGIVIIAYLYRHYSNKPQLDYDHLDKQGTPQHT
jgi:predicted MFS family arabinose efflux permease